MRRALLALVCAAPLAAQEVAFEVDVLPILKEHCFSCHRGEHTDANGRVRKPKGGLRLDGAAWIQKGGKEGAVVTPGKPEQSPLYTRTVLPADHDDRMPANGDPLSAAQAAVLKRWIEAGAKYGAWVGEAGPSGVPAEKSVPVAAPAPNAYTTLLATLGAGLTPLPPAALDKVVAATQARAQILPLADGSPLLAVEFLGHEDHVTDADVAALAPLRERIAILSLGRTKVTDAVGARLAGMPHLVRLDLRETKFGDAGMRALGALPELRELNLFGTLVSDNAVDALAALPQLASLRLWQSKATEAGVAKLRTARPGLEVQLAPEMPAPAQPGAAAAGRRRRGN